MADLIKVIPSLEALDALTAANKYVVLDFTATWCGPCKAISPFYQKLAAEHAVDGSLAFAKVDVDEAAEVAQKFEVTAMPTFVFLVDGERAGVDVGTALPAKPNLIRVEGSGDEGPLVAIRGADPKSLLDAVAKVAELAKGSKVDEAESA